MTYADKYLKDGVDVKEFNKELFKNCVTGELFNYINTTAVINWLNSEVKPTLSEDEKVILKHINKRFNTIQRNDFGYLILTENGCKSIGEAMCSFSFYNDLFQFIEKGEQYKISDLLEE